MKTEIWKHRIVKAGLGFAGAAALFDTLSISTQTARNQVAASYSFLSFLFCIFGAILYEKVLQTWEKKRAGEWLIPGGVGLLFSLALTVGKRLETEDHFYVAEVQAWLTVLLLTVFFTPFIKYTWEKIQSADPVLEGEEKSRFWRNWLLIFLCWLPVFLAFYPGAFVYDAQDEYVQAASRNFTTHHPLVHVLLLGGAVCAGNKFFHSYNIGIACYTLFQMLVLSGVFSYTIEYVSKKWKWKHIQKLCLIFYGFFPVISMYAVCSAKDGLFTAAFLVVIIKMLQFFEDPEGFLGKKGNIAAGFLAAVAMMLLRNNGMYAYVVWIPLAAAAMAAGKKDKKNAVFLAAFMMGAVITFLLVSRLLAGILGAEDSESQEIMTVPIQQMVRTYVYSPETYVEEEKQLLFELIPEEDMKLYDPRLSDLVKSKFQNENFNKDKGKYLRLWIKIGLRKPLIYLNAWWLTSYGYWYPDAVINVYGGHTVHTFTYEDSSYFGFETEAPGVRDSRFPWLEEKFRKMSLELYQHRVPGVSMLFSPGFLFFVFVYFMGFLAWQKKWQKVIPLSGILLLWLTAVLGPTYLVRYVLILWFALPVIVTETKS